MRSRTHAAKSYLSDVAECGFHSRINSIRCAALAIVIANILLNIPRQYSCKTSLRETYRNYLLLESDMDYLLVIFALASMGAVFAGLKKVNRAGKGFNRLEL